MHSAKHVTGHSCAGIGLAFFCLTAIGLSSCKKDKKEDPPACSNNVAPKGKLVVTGSGLTADFSYTTSGGGHIKYSVKFKNIVITHDNYPGFKIEFWGDTHENLNGKHIKDRFGNNRSFVFPDGAKVTMIAAGETMPITSISIYEAGEVHLINSTCNTVSNSITSNAAKVQELDNAEPDGETASIEFLPNGLNYVNIYREDTPGNKIQARVLLGSLNKNNPNEVNDYFDDPRRGDT